MSWFDSINLVPDALQSTFSADEGRVVYMDPTKQCEVSQTRAVVGDIKRDERSAESGRVQVSRVSLRIDRRDFAGQSISPQRGGYIRIGDAEFHVISMTELGAADIEVVCEAVGQTEISHQGYRTSIPSGR